MNIDPVSLNSLESYQLLISIIVPRPIAFVSTISDEGVLNLAPFSFFTGICAKPPIICFSIGSQRGNKKDTMSNIESTGEFVVNIVSENFAQAMNMTAANYPPEVDEFEIGGFTPIASNRVKPPRVREAHINMECEILEIREYGEMPYAAGLVIGQVLMFHLSDECYQNKQVDNKVLNAIGRMGGDLYCRTGDLFEMKRPEYKR